MKDPSLPRNKQWLNSLSLLVGEASKLEISTTIVPEIVPEVFIPYEAYWEIYQITPAFLIESGIDPSLRDRFIQLRRQLELQYALLLLDNNSSLYSPQLAPEVNQDLPLLCNAKTHWENLPCRLPPPVRDTLNTDNHKLTSLLNEPKFLRVLKQIREVKTTLDGRNQLLTKPTSTTTEEAVTYIQTKIRLDGTIDNCYSDKIIQHPQQEVIVKLHQQGITAAEAQWRKLFGFILQILQRQQTPRF